MLNPYYFIERALRVGFSINLSSHHNNNADKKLFITSEYPEFGKEVRYINKILKKLSIIYARLIGQYKFRYQTVFSAIFDKQDEDNQVLDETVFFTNLNNYHNLRETDIN